MWTITRLLRLCDASHHITFAEFYNTSVGLTINFAVLSLFISFFHFLLYLHSVKQWLHFLCYEFGCIEFLQLFFSPDYLQRLRILTLGHIFVHNTCRLISCLLINATFHYTIFNLRSLCLLQLIRVTLFSLNRFKILCNWRWLFLLWEVSALNRVNFYIIRYLK